MVRRRIASWLPLFTNHMDAWGLTLIIAAVCTLIHGAASLERIGLLITLAVTCWLAFAVNDFFDAPLDAQDEFKRARNFFVTPRSRVGLAIILVVTLVGLLISYASYGLRGLTVLGIIGVATWAYSAPPLRLKARPGFDLLMHGVFVQTAPYFVCLFLLGTSWIALDYVLLATFFLSSLAAQLEQQMRDYEVDARTEGNFTTRIGRRVAALLMRLATASVVVLLVVSFISSLIPFYVVPFGLISLPIVLHRFLRRADEPRSQRLVIAMIIVALLYTGGIWSAAAFQLVG